MEKFIDTIQEGQTLMTNDGKTFTAVNPHRNTDETDSPFIVYDADGSSYFEEDLDIRQSEMPAKKSDMNENKEITVFSKFSIPKGATAVQTAVIYTMDEGKTWSKQIPSELTIACPEEIEYLPMQGRKAQMKELGHNFVENMWRNGFNTCIELFMTGKISQDGSTDENGKETHAQPPVPPHVKHDKL